VHQHCSEKKQRLSFDKTASQEKGDGFFINLFLIKVHKLEYINGAMNPVYKVNTLKKISVI